MKSSDKEEYFNKYINSKCLSSQKENVSEP